MSRDKHVKQQLPRDVEPCGCVYMQRWIRTSDESHRHLRSRRHRPGHLSWASSLWQCACCLCHRRGSCKAMFKTRKKQQRCIEANATQILNKTRTRGRCEKRQTDLGFHPFTVRPRSTSTSTRLPSILRPSALVNTGLTNRKGVKILERANLSKASFTLRSSSNSMNA